MRALLLIAIVALAGCASTPPEPKIVTRDVMMPVAQPCPAEPVPAPPAYPDTAEALRAAPGPDNRYRLLAAGWLVRDARLRMLEAVVAACRKPTP